MVTGVQTCALPIYVLAGAAVIGGVIAATIQRLHEISGGEEEDAKRY